MATGFIIQAVDSTMVAPMGTMALAALGVAATAAFIPNAFTLGLISSVQKQVAVAGSKHEMNRAVTSGLLLACLFALPMSLFYYFFSVQIVSVFTHGEVVELASTFLRIFAPSFVFAAMNQALNGYWIGQLKSKTRLSITIATTIINVIGNLILSPYFGLAGVAVSSLLAIVSGTFINLYLTARLEGFRSDWPSRHEVIRDAQVVLGVSIHQVSLALVLNSAIFVVGLIGVEALAIANVIGTLSLPILYLGIGYGTATGSFLVKELSNQQMGQARNTARQALFQVFLISLMFAVALIFFSEEIRHWFFKDEKSFRMAEIPLMLLAALYLVDGVCCALQRFHFVTGGLQQSFLVMSVVQWCLFVPGAYVGVKFLGMDYSSYLMFHIGQRALIAIILYAIWVSRTTSLKLQPL